MTPLKKILGIYYIIVVKRVKWLIRSKYNFFTIFIFFRVTGKSNNWVFNSHSLTFYSSMFDTKYSTKSIKILNKEGIIAYYTIEIDNS